LFVGEADGMERDLVTRAKIPFQAICAGAIHGVGARRALRGAWRTLWGSQQALRILDTFKPQVVFLTGGFVGVPVAVAAWLRRVPSVVYLPDIEPGYALRLMAHLATCVAVTAEQSAAFLPRKKMIVTGYPVRDVFKTVSRASARQQFGLSEADRVVLIYGGSKGARSINHAVLAALPDLLALAVVIHITGKADWAEISAARARLGEEQRRRYLVFDYLHDEMASAMAAADLAVCRAGASVLGELPYLGLPAILVPYPYAWRYQHTNASYLAKRGAAVVLQDDQLLDRQTGLLPWVHTLLNSPDRLAAMRWAAQQTGHRNGAERIASLLLTVSQAHDQR
jgi:UDP-N-acetylglucosamine--N-acetylmuramyl-(pentapeptide) pyrophosphoryl-undecaprenol N-acetylglucosamine transferase